MEAQEVVIIIGGISALVVTIAGTFLKYLSNVTKQDRSERVDTAKLYNQSLDMLAQNLRENTDSNRRIADEAKERNGHLAELQIKSQEMIDRNLKCYQEMMKEQHVNSQTVDEQIVKHCIDK